MKKTFYVFSKLRIKSQNSLSKKLLILVNCLSGIFLSTYAYGIDGIAQEAPPNIGNFALPTPQQPGPLISFGQRVINKDQKQLYFFVDYLTGFKLHAVDIVSSFVYGIRDDLSIQINLPIAASYKLR